jgi:hypothetical protein
LIPFEYRHKTRPASTTSSRIDLRDKDDHPSSSTLMPWGIFSSFFHRVGNPAIYLAVY